MVTFGETLRAFRQACNDPHRLNRRLSQERLGRLIGEELEDLGFTGAAVSYWESGESKISADDRKVLLALIKVLHDGGGLKTLTEANQFLELGNFRVLGAEETQKIFVKDEVSKSSIPFLIVNLFRVSEDELKRMITKAQDGPAPSWPRVLAGLMRKAADRFSISFITILWVWVWLIAWWLIAPSLNLSFADQRELLSAIRNYVIGTLIVPLLIGLLVDTNKNEYWRRQSGVNPLLLRLYTYQGAGIGFNLGYFFIIPFSLVRYYLQMEPAVSLGIVASTLGLILGNMGARVVPHNLWLAYHRLKFSDGAIFFVFALLGPLWALFFLEFHAILLTPSLGTAVILIAFMFVVVIATWQTKKQKG